LTGDIDAILMPKKNILLTDVFLIVEVKVLRIILMFICKRFNI